MKYGLIALFAALCPSIGNAASEIDISDYIQRCVTEMRTLTPYQRQQIEGNESKLATAVLRNSGMPLSLIQQMLELSRKNCRQAAILESATVTEINKLFAKSEADALRQSEQTTKNENKARWAAIRTEQNPGALIVYDGQDAMGTRLSYKPAGSSKTVQYRTFRNWVDRMIGKWNPIIQSSNNLNGANNHYRCKKDIAEQWVQSFGYAHTSLEFAFDGAPAERYDRRSVTHGVCLTTLLQLSGFGVNDD